MRFVLLLPLLLLPLMGTKLVPQSREQIRLSYAPLVREVAPAVVNVYAARAVERRRSPFRGDPFFERFFGGGGPPRERMSRSLGSGVVVDDRGTVVTNVHVVQGADVVRVATNDGREFAAELVLEDEASDIAVLRVEAPEGLSHLQLGDSDGLEVGDLVLAVGNPFGVGQTVTSGIVSGLARTQITRSVPGGASDFGYFIQTDASINPGNSGGALIGMDGRLVGINTAIFSRSGGSNGIGFAVPSNMVAVVLDSARKGLSAVERPVVGATFEAVTFELAQALGLDRPAGALVVDVEEGGPAAAAGLRAGDVILSVDDRPVQHLDALGYRLAVVGPGREVDLDVLSRNERRTVPITLGRETPAKPVAITGRSPFAGLTVAAATRSQRRRLRLNGPATVVTDVRPNSPAARAGFLSDDVILSVNEVAVEAPDVLQALGEIRSRLWRLDLLRDGRRLRSVIR